MTRKNQLRRSGTRLQQQGALWLQQTRNAGGTFVTEAQDASVTFGQDMKAASAKLVRTAGRSAQGFQKALNKEARDWQAVVLQTRDGYMAAAEERRERVERQAVSAREALKPGAVETTVLQSAHGLLELAQSRVDARLEQGAKPAAAKTASKPTAVKVGAKKGQSPMRNYDQLTAKDLVTRVQKLSAPQATAVLDYERGRKKRATVIRAAEQRLAAAS
ncbi:MAG: hypothetical protein JRJ80_01530 [Deltaproteobacteria bacterium]|nr:hypothetical protein [Deltaproteobacteria bacterium]